MKWQILPCISKGTNYLGELDTPLLYKATWLVVSITKKTLISRLPSLEDEKVYLPLCKVADTPFQLQRDGVGLLSFLDLPLSRYFGKK